MPEFKDKPVIEGVFEKKDIIVKPPEEITDKEDNKDNDVKEPDSEPDKPENNKPKPVVPPKEDKEITVDSLSLEEKIGQLFIVRNPAKDAQAKITEYNLGGYILFARDFQNKTKNQVKTMINNYQKTAKIPMLIGVDEEGGTVVRVSKYKALRSEPFKSPQELYGIGGMDAIKEDAIIKSKFLKEYGININFAPVSDVSTDETDYIYKRTLGKGAAETAEYVKTVVTAMKKEKMGSVLKHFPGYGNNIDTHTGIAIDERSYESLKNNDFLPFIAGINSGAPVVMVSHNIINSIDPENPASLSSKVHNVLRDELKFNGVIVTDDLSMGAIKNYSSNVDPAVKAILAGNDLICCTDFEKHIPAVISAVKSGIISEQRINESAERVLKMKKDLGIITK